MTKNLTVFDSQHCAGSSQTHRHPASVGSGLPESPEGCRFPIMPEVIRRMSAWTCGRRRSAPRSRFLAGIRPQPIRVTRDGLPVRHGLNGTVL
jgi:hypothetical protein